MLQLPLLTNPPSIPHSSPTTHTHSLTHSLIHRGSQSQRGGDESQSSISPHRETELSRSAQIPPILCPHHKATPAPISHCSKTTSPSSTSHCRTQIPPAGPPVPPSPPGGRPHGTKRGGPCDQALSGEEREREAQLTRWGVYMIG